MLFVIVQVENYSRAREGSIVGGVLRCLFPEKIVIFSRGVLRYLFSILSPLSSAIILLALASNLLNSLSSRLLSAQ